jgi:glycyl-tRNA synthetase
MVKEQVMDISLRRGFVWPSFEIYGGMKGFYDYGPLGSLLKKNIEEVIRKQYVIGEGCLEVTCPTVTPEDVWVASGHVTSFSDAIVDCTKCGEPYRADHLVGEHTDIQTDGMNLEQLQEEIKKNKIVCPKCKSALSEPYDYNLMFKTYVGPGKYKTTAYLRPETAQTTYLPFKRLYSIGREKIPFGVLQIGHSFRNEISPRQGMIRLREFTQAEIQFFVDPEDKSAPRISEVEDFKLRILSGERQEKGETDPEEMSLRDALSRNIITIEMIGYQLVRAMQVFERMGINREKLYLRQHKSDERAFYSSDTWDIEYISQDYGRIELVGISDRTDHDLSAHQNLSKVEMKVNKDGRKFVPHVVEVAFGIDRPVYCVLESCFVEQTGEKERTYFKFPIESAPYVAAVFPLVNKNGIPEKAREVFEKLQAKGIYILWDTGGSIGRRYARADEIGVPYCITIDFDTLDDDTVTVRHRDSMTQERIKISELCEKLI